MHAGAGAAAGPRREVWTSKLAFLYSAAAAAIGLGSLWRFPYVAGANGGGAFVLLYIVFVLVLCVPIMVAEMAIGKRGHGSAITSVNALVAAEGASRSWRVIGWLSLLIPFFGLSYYSVVAGWGLDYARLAVVRGFTGIDAPGSLATFDELIASPFRQALLQFIFIAATAAVVARGVRGGIEVVSKIKMLALFVILIGLVIYNAVTVGLGDSVRFLFVPNFAALTAEGVLTALGQALFSTAIGVGVLMTYSAYLPRGVSLPQSGLLIASSVIFIAMMAGLAIFPTVLGYGLEPTEGPNLIFVTLPVAFGQMPGGRVVSVLFFGLIALGAFTTAVGMLEPVVAWLQEKTKLGRASLAAMTGLAIWAVGLPSLLSFNVLKDVHPLGWLPLFEGRTFFDVLDFGIANLLLPVNAVLIALFVGWAVRRKTSEEELGLGKSMFRLWHLALRIIAPIAIIGLMIDLLA